MTSMPLMSFTVIFAVALTEEFSVLIAVTVTSPDLCAVTTPFADTDATVLSEEDHVTFAEALEGFGTAVSVAVCPAVSVSVEGDIERPSISALLRLP